MIRLKTSLSMKHIYITATLHRFNGKSICNTKFSKMLHILENFLMTFLSLDLDLDIVLKLGVRVLGKGVDI